MLGRDRAETMSGVTTADRRTAARAAVSIPHDWPCSFNALTMPVPLARPSWRNFEVLTEARTRLECSLAAYLTVDLPSRAFKSKVQRVLRPASDRHQNYHREDINGGWVDPPRAKIPNEVRNREHPKWNAGNQHYREQGGAQRSTGLNNLFVHFTELASFPPHSSGLNSASSRFIGE